MKRPSSTPPDRAALYRKAARNVERQKCRYTGHPSYAEIAVAEVFDPSYEGHGCDKRAEVQFFNTLLAQGAGNWLEDDEAVVALCLVAAMVEAGDA